MSRSKFDLISQGDKEGTNKLSVQVKSQNLNKINLSTSLSYVGFNTNIRHKGTHGHDINFLRAAQALRTENS